MKLYYDVEIEEIVTEDEMRDFWEGLPDDATAEYENDFDSYAKACLTVNGGCLKLLRGTNEQIVFRYMRDQFEEFVDQTGEVPNTNNWIDLFESEFYNQTYGKLGLTLGDMINYFVRKEISA